MPANAGIQSFGQRTGSPLSRGRAAQLENPVSSHRSDGGIWLDRALGAAAAVLLFGLMMITTVDVIGRYILNWPLRGAFEITELLLLALIFAGLPLVSRADEHVTLDFIDAALGKRGRALLRRLVDIVCALIILGLAWRVFVKAGKIAGYGDTTDVLRIPVGPFVYFMALMVAVTAIVHLIKAFLPGAAEEPKAFDPDKVSTT
jgi:TRAP-type C4-dicarboxylate transport system permease small subunit